MLFTTVLVTSLARVTFDGEDWGDVGAAWACSVVGCSCDSETPGSEVGSPVGNSSAVGTPGCDAIGSLRGDGGASGRAAYGPPGWLSAGAAVGDWSPSLSPIEDIGEP